MSMQLDNAPHRVEVKSKQIPGQKEEIVLFTDDRGSRIELPVCEFLNAVRYVLTNTELSGLADSRIKFLEDIKSARLVLGQDQRELNQIELGGTSYTPPEDLNLRLPRVPTA